MTKIVKTTVTQEVKMSNDEMFALSKHNWNSIKRMIGYIKSPQNFVSVIYSTLFGVAITAFFTLFTLPANTSPWIKPAFIVCALGTLTVSLILFIIEKKVLKITEVQTTDILKEMEKIEELY